MAGIGANIFASGGASAGATAPTMSNATPTYGPPTSGAGLGSLSPRRPFGMAVWWSAAGLLALALIRYSLPR